MMLPLLLSAALAQAPPRVQRYRIDGWMVTKREDAFANTRQCTVQGRRLDLEGPTLWFDMGRTVRTGNVVYRIDDGPPRFLQNPDLDPLRVSHDLALNNPSGGRVGLPVVSLMGARTVWVRADGARRPTRFDVSHLQDALDLKARLDCPPSPSAPVEATAAGVARSSSPQP